jgi:asparagine synthase (glutamine-hydrolysing)
MCGISGLFNFNKNQPADRKIMQAMLARIQHRGPDESGVYLGQNVGLGNVRLSIIDLKTGQQPMPNEDGSLWIVINGEIFNYIELREELQKKGHVFKTTSDTEVVVHCYEEYGTACLNKFNGQFAIAIWDTKKRELFLARDRVGIRPLFYTKTQYSFVFASEIKSFLEHPEVNFRFSPESLSQIFTFWSTTAPNTAFQDIYELPAGHFMKVSFEGVEIRPYWNLTFPEEGNENNLSFPDAMEELHSLFEDSVKIRLRADVPVGAYLSGGIDSSITTAFIKNIFPEVLRTFSIGFDEKEYDESSYQQLAIHYLNTNHSGVSCSAEDIAANFEKVVYHTEIPILRTSPVPMYLLSKSVRNNNYKVVITGEGADEMFAGYNIFKETMIRRFWARYPDSKYRPLLLKKLYPYITQMSGASNAALKFFFGYKLDETGSPAYSHLLRWNNTSRIKNMFSDPVKEAFSAYDPVEEYISNLPEGFDQFHPLSKAQWIETNLFMSDYLLSSQGDRMAMANSVEGRYPFLDHRIMEFASKLPPDFKLHGLKEKHLLKEMMRGKLPDEIVNRPKQAYRAPITNSFLSEKSDYVNEMLKEEYLKKTELFDPKQVSKLFSKIKHSNSASEVENMALTGILSTLILEKQFVGKGKDEFKEKVPVNCRVIQGF